jgi:hypothetical protein
MMTNIFEILQTMINYSFFLNQDDDDDWEPSLDSFGEALKSHEVAVPKLKELNSFVATNDDENDFDADAVWLTFQNVTNSLDKLPKKEYGINFNAHPLMILHFATQIMDSFKRCYNEIKPSYTGDEGSAVLESLSATVDTVKDRLITSICDGWVKVSRSFFQFEDWTFENNATSSGNQYDCSSLMKFSSIFFKFVIRGLALIAANDNIQEDVTISNTEHTEKIRVAIFESMLGLLDGFQCQLSRFRNPTDKQVSDIPGWAHPTETVKLKSILPDQKNKFGQFIPSECTNLVEMAVPKDFRRTDDRNLMILCNLIYSRHILLEQLNNIFQTKFHQDISMDTIFFIENIDLLERIILLNFVKRQGLVIRNYIKNAIFYSGLDWSSLNKPHEIRPYCYHILHHLVYAHASISEISKNLVPKVMAEIVMFLAQELIMAVRNVDRYNISGMLQVKLSN